MAPTGGSLLARSLRARTVALFLLAGVGPLALVGGMALWQIEAVLVASIHRDHEEQVRQVRLDVEGEIQGHRRLLRGLARRLNVQRMKPPGALKVLDEFLEYEKVFDQIRLLDRNGAEVVVAGKGGEVEPGRIRVDFREPVPSFTLGGKPVGTLEARIQLTGVALQRILDDRKTVDPVAVYLIDDQGLVRARVGPEARADVQRIALPGRDWKAIPDEEIVSGQAEVLGREELVALARLHGLGLGLVVLRPYADVEKVLVELLSSVGAYVVLGAVLAALLGILLAGGLVAPILELTRGLEKASEGELGHRVETDRQDEVGRAAAAFNQLASALNRARLLEETWTLRRGARGKGEEGEES